MTDFITGNYPLNCIDDTGDGFSGWFAISNPRQCNDFCYWQLPSHANPHKSTVVSTPIGTAYWTCAYDSADDKTMASVTEEHRWVDSWRKYSFPPKDGKSHLEDIENVPFPYLKCQKVAGELLETWSGDVVKSAAFWESLIVLTLVGEIAALFFFGRRDKLSRNDRKGLETGSVLESGLDLQEFDDRRIDFVPVRWSFLPSISFNQSLNSKNASPRCKCCTPLAPRIALHPSNIVYGNTHRIASCHTILLGSIPD